MNSSADLRKTWHAHPQFYPTKPYCFWDWSLNNSLIRHIDLSECYRSTLPTSKTWNVPLLGNESLHSIPDPLSIKIDAVFLFYLVLEVSTGISSFFGYRFPEILSISKAIPNILNRSTIISLVSIMIPTSSLVIQLQSWDTSEPINFIPNAVNLLFKSAFRIRISGPQVVRFYHHLSNSFPCHLIERREFSVLIRLFGICLSVCLTVHLFGVCLTITFERINRLSKTSHVF